MSSFGFHTTPIDPALNSSRRPRRFRRKSNKSSIDNVNQVPPQLLLPTQRSKTLQNTSVPFDIRTAVKFRPSTGVLGHFTGSPKAKVIPTEIPTTRDDSNVKLYSTLDASVKTTVTEVQTLRLDLNKAQETMYNFRVQLDAFRDMLGKQQQQQSTPICVFATATRDLEVYPDPVEVDPESGFSIKTGERMLLVYPHQLIDKTMWVKVRRVDSFGKVIDFWTKFHCENEPKGLFENFTFST